MEGAQYVVGKYKQKCQKIHENNKKYPELFIKMLHILLILQVNVLYQMGQIYNNNLKKNQLTNVYLKKFKTGKEIRKTITPISTATIVLEIIIPAKIFEKPKLILYTASKNKRFYFSANSWKHLAFNYPIDMTSEMFI